MNETRPEAQNENAEKPEAAPADWIPNDGPEPGPPSMDSLVKEFFLFALVVIAFVLIGTGLLKMAGFMPDRTETATESQGGGDDWGAAQFPEEFEPREEE